MLSLMSIHRSRALWSLWAKAGAVGNGAAVVHRKPAGAAPAASSTNPQRRAALAASPAVVLRVHAQPVSPQSLELVPEQWGVHVLAFVAKPEQLPERTSHVARMGYDERYS
jgi:hypothetical protein